MDESLVAYPCGNLFPVLLVDRIDGRGATNVSGILPSYLTIEKLNELLETLAGLDGGPFFHAAFVSKDAEDIRFRAKVQELPGPRKDGRVGIALKLTFEGEPPRPAKSQGQRAPKPGGTR